MLHRFYVEWTMLTLFSSVCIYPYEVPSNVGVIIDSSRLNSKRADNLEEDVRIEKKRIRVEILSRLKEKTKIYLTDY